MHIYVHTYKIPYPLARLVDVTEFKAHHVLLKRDGWHTSYHVYEPYIVYMPCYVTRYLW